MTKETVKEVLGNLGKDLETGRDDGGAEDAGDAEPRGNDDAAAAEAGGFEFVVRNPLSPHAQK